MRIQVSPAHALGAFCGLVSTKSKLKKSEGYFFKEAQAAPLHERGAAALSDKKNLLLKSKKDDRQYAHKTNKM